MNTTEIEEREPTTAELILRLRYLFAQRRARIAAESEAELEISQDPKEADLEPERCPVRIAIFKESVGTIGQMMDRFQEHKLEECSICGTHKVVIETPGRAA